MKAFREMVTLISKQNLHKIEVIDPTNDLSNDNLYHLLFKGIANGTLVTDEDAALAIYKTSPKSKKYQMLKSRLKDRLTNSLFFLNHKKNHDSIYQQSVFICNKNYFCAKILLTHGARTSAVSIARSTLAIALKFDLNDMVLFCSKILRTHYSMAGLRKEHAHYHLKVNDSIRKITAENKAEFMYETLVTEYAKSKSDKPELASKAKNFFEQSRVLSQQEKTFHIYLLYYRTGILYYQIINNYAALLKLLISFQTFLKKHPTFYLTSREGEICMLKMSCFHHLKDFNNGKRNAEEALKHYPKGRNNWFTLMENYFLLSMHSQKFEVAQSILEEVESNSRFQYLSPEKIEAWKIYAAYTNYVLPEKKKTVGFKILKFLNEVPIYSKDKTGYFPAILIAQLLYLIDRWDEERLEKTIESLRIFSSRHLNSKNAPRTVIFIKMLRQLINNNYDLGKVKKRTQQHLDKLLDKSYQKLLDIDAMEIILYTIIWEIILKRLAEKRNQRGELRKNN